jgi:uncharacterized protein YecT (DUF1311 family)
MATGILQPDAAGRESREMQESWPAPLSLEPQSHESQPQEPQAPVSNYDKTIFQQPIPSNELAFLNQLAGLASSDAIRDKQYRKLMSRVVPNCMFHYGRDMPLSDALDMVFKGSTSPVQIRDGRYVLVSGESGPYLAGRGFMWIDIQDGISLGGFYFHPTNGEPTPTVAVFSKQIKENSLKMSQLPPAFAEDLSQWSQESRVPPITTRYFLTGTNERILLEHDEDYCAPVGGSAIPSEGDCEQMNADAADIDMNAAYYLEQTHYATNATAWMIVGEEQVAWIRVRDDTCRIGPDPLRCHIRMTREHTHVIVNRHPGPHPPHK